jgi:hypothetical protein
MVDNPCCEGVFRPNNDEVCSSLLDGPFETRKVSGFDIKIDANLGCAGVTRRNEDLVYSLALAELPYDGMFSGSAADNQYFQF